MKESLIICPHCKGNACSEISNDKLTIWICFGCGFTSNSSISKENKEQSESFLPELYKDLCYEDENGHYWYPTSVSIDDSSMVFAEGTSTQDWKWSAVQAKDGKADMKTKKEFEQKDFMEALDYIGYFK